MDVKGSCWKKTSSPPVVRLPMIMMEWNFVSSWIRTWTDYIEWSQTPISTKRMLENVADQQKGRTLVHKLCQRVWHVEERLKEAIPPPAAAFVVREDRNDWTIPS